MNHDEETRRPNAVPYTDENATWEAIEEMLTRIDAREADVQALLPDENAEERRGRLRRTYEDEAQTADRSRERTPSRRGLVVGVKDLFHTIDFPTRGGSSLPTEVFLENDAPGRPPIDTRDGASTRADAEVVARLRAAGALVLGKTVSTEFAYFAPGPTRNPLNLEHTPGGSSSGSAAAVAAGYCHAALGTQTIGSITRPASFCGVVGYKPSFGRIPIGGTIPFSPSADHVGVIAADVATASAVAAVIVDDWESDAADTSHAREEIDAARQAASPQQGISAVPPGLRNVLPTALGTILVPDDLYVAQADDDGRRGLEAAVERLAGLGVRVQHVSIMDDIEAINALHKEMIARDFADVHHRWVARFADRYDARSVELVETGRSVTDERYDEARTGRFELRKRLDGALERHGASLWIAPATTGEAPEGISATGNPIMNLPWTYAGVPTVSLPVHHLPHGTGDHGLPLGVQIAAPFGHDETLMYITTLIEAAFGS